MYKMKYKNFNELSSFLYNLQMYSWKKKVFAKLNLLLLLWHEELSL